jgi:hypothetical protein
MTSTPVTNPTGVPPARIAVASIPDGLMKEIQEFRADCQSRYRFNSNWDNVLNVTGIATSLMIVACGVYKWSNVAAILGGGMTAIVSLQRAFPFTQRWQFYRLLRSQTENLLTEAKNGTVAPDQAITILKALRLDFAQQIPRGSSFRGDNNSSDTTAPS